MQNWGEDIDPLQKRKMPTKASLLLRCRRSLLASGARGLLAGVGKQRSSKMKKKILFLVDFSETWWNDTAQSKVGLSLSIV
ncbi:hypothetical protein BRADI_3g41993v3 [Brachypodium distachyon]|uniref:Uncharacterized protein n=1 Tax=Brachypodium distachyon TaxID=15368 RepID=A0A2K2D2L5_BRADI|nr:hypothetical protein BRADI_3g41993v3 [Brachypodium distachyon]